MTWITSYSVKIWTERSGRSSVIKEFKYQYGKIEGDVLWRTCRNPPPMHRTVPEAMDNVWTATETLENLGMRKSLHVAT